MLLKGCETPADAFKDLPKLVAEYNIAAEHKEGETRDKSLWTAFKNIVSRPKISSSFSPDLTSSFIVLVILVGNLFDSGGSSNMCTNTGLGFLRL
jgi:hypothetical protein